MPLSFTIVPKNYLDAVESKVCLISSEDIIASIQITNKNSQIERAANSSQVETQQFVIVGIKKTRQQRMSRAIDDLTKL